MGQQYFRTTAEIVRPPLPTVPAPADLRSGGLIDPQRLANLSGVSEYLSVSSSVARAILAERGISQRVGGRYDLRDLWMAFWGIRDVPEPQITLMCEPLMTVAEVAQLAGVSERTIRRAGDARSPVWALPRHVDLGPRVRRYLRPLITAWVLQIPPEAWLMPAPRRPILGGSLLLKGGAGGKSSTNGQSTKQPPK